MPKQRRIGPFMSNGEFQTFQDSKEMEEAGEVDRSGETGFLLKDTIYTDLPRSSPFSSLARSLQAPQTRAQTSAVTHAKAKKKHLEACIDYLEEKQLFQLVFLSDDENQSVEVEEVEEINFAEVRARLEHGDSIFITRRENEKMDTAILDRETSISTR